MAYNSCINFEGDQNMASTITSKQLQDFRVHLHQEERTPGTIEKYLRDVHSFSAWLDGREVTKELAADVPGERPRIDPAGV